MIDLILLFIGVLGISIASLTDLKKREVPDWICYSMIAAGLGTRTITTILTQDYHYVLYGILGFAGAFIIANILYYTKQWGGGDSKLLMGVGAIFGNGLSLPGLTAHTNWPWLLVFLLNLFMLGAVYGLFFALGLAIAHRKAVFHELKKQNSGIYKISIPVFILLFLGSLFFLKGVFQFLAANFIIVLFITFHSLFLLRSIEKVALQRWIEVDRLTEGDWILNTVKVGSKTICSSEDLGLDQKQITLLKKYNIKKVLIKEGIPFVPSFFFALVATLFFGNFLTSFF